MSKYVILMHYYTNQWYVQICVLHHFYGLSNINEKYVRLLNLVLISNYFKKTLRLFELGLL